MEGAHSEGPLLAESRRPRLSPLGLLLLELGEEVA
jgi:hypothetical protein